MSEPDEVEQLVAILSRHPDAWTRAEAALKLGELADERALEPLIYQMKHDEHDFVRRDSAEALGLLDMNEAQEALIDCAMNDSFSYARNEAIEALGLVGNEKCITELEDIMIHEEWDFARASAAISLAKLGSSGSVPKIMKMIQEENDVFAKRDLLDALKIFKDIRTRSLLISMLKNEDNWELRKKSASILANLASSDVVEELVKAVKMDSHLFVRQEAEKSLQIIAHDYKIPWTSAEALLARKNEIIDD
ncbi:MAG: HEAT repeat domain-containing protein [Candidatus Heimdallarchaeota archaeon]|nr:HEAT repeat domain-containing protein [Candidatus Heimdallarchaeota archaeon]